MQEMFEAERFVTDLNGLLREEVQRCSTAHELERVASLVADAAENELQRCQDAEEVKAIACAAGCGTCCSVNVAVLFPEAVAIYQYLYKEWEQPELDRLKTKLDDLYAATRWLDDEERIAMRRSCVFLDERGSCSVYSVRPLLCRSVTSVDAQHCEDALVARIFGDEAPILMNLFQKQLMETAFCSMGDFLIDNGWDGQGLRLTSIMKYLFDDPALIEKYWQGAKICH